MIGSSSFTLGGWYLMRGNFVMKKDSLLVSLF